MQYLKIINVNDEIKQKVWNENLLTNPDFNGRSNNVESPISRNKMKNIYNQTDTYFGSPKIFEFFKQSHQGFRIKNHSEKNFKNPFIKNYMQEENRMGSTQYNPTKNEYLLKNQICCKYLNTSGKENKTDMSSIYYIGQNNNPFHFKDENLKANDYKYINNTEILRTSQKSSSFKNSHHEDFSNDKKDIFIEQFTKSNEYYNSNIQDFNKKKDKNRTLVRTSNNKNSSNKELKNLNIQEYKNKNVNNDITNFKSFMFLTNHGKLVSHLDSLKDKTDEKTKKKIEDWIKLNKNPILNFHTGSFNIPLCANTMSG